MCKGTREEDENCYLSGDKRGGGILACVRGQERRRNTAMCKGTREEEENCHV